MTDRISERFLPKAPQDEGGGGAGSPAPSSGGRSPIDTYKAPGGIFVDAKALQIISAFDPYDINSVRKVHQQFQGLQIKLDLPFYVSSNLMPNFVTKVVKEKWGLSKLTFVRIPLIDQMTKKEWELKIVQENESQNKNEPRSRETGRFIVCKYRIDGSIKDVEAFIEKFSEVTNLQLLPIVEPGKQIGSPEWVFELSIDDKQGDLHKLKPENIDQVALQLKEQFEALRKKVEGPYEGVFLRKLEDCPEGEDYKTNLFYDRQGQVEAGPHLLAPPLDGQVPTVRKVLSVWSGEEGLLPLQHNYAPRLFERNPKLFGLCKQNEQYPAFYFAKHLTLPSASQLDGMVSIAITEVGKPEDLEKVALLLAHAHDPDNPEAPLLIAGEVKVTDDAVYLPADYKRLGKLGRYLFEQERAIQKTDPATAALLNKLWWQIEGERRGLSAQTNSKQVSVRFEEFPLPDDMDIREVAYYLADTVLNGNFGGEMWVQNLAIGISNNENEINGYMTALLAKLETDPHKARLQDHLFFAIAGSLSPAQYRSALVLDAPEYAPLGNPERLAAFNGKPHDPKYFGLLKSRAFAVLLSSRGTILSGDMQNNGGGLLIPTDYSQLGWEEQKKIREKVAKTAQGVINELTKFKKELEEKKATDQEVKQVVQLTPIENDYYGLLKVGEMIALLTRLIADLEYLRDHPTALNQLNFEESQDLQRSLSDKNTEAADKNTTLVLEANRQAMRENTLLTLLVFAGLHWWSIRSMRRSMSGGGNAYPVSPGNIAGSSPPPPSEGSRRFRWPLRHFSLRSPIVRETSNRFSLSPRENEPIPRLRFQLLGDRRPTISQWRFRSPIDVSLQSPLRRETPEEQEARRQQEIATVSGGGLMNALGVPTPRPQDFYRDLTEEARAGGLTHVVPTGVDPERPNVGRVVTRTSEVTSQDRNANAVIAGRKGRGKSTEEEGMAIELALRGDYSRPVWHINMGALYQGAQLRGGFETNVRLLINHAIAYYDRTGRRPILVFDEGHMVMNAGASSESSVNLNNLLKEEMARGRISCVFITTGHREEGRWQGEITVFFRDEAFIDRCTIIEKPEPTEAEVRRILRDSTIPRLERAHGVVFERTILDHIYYLTDLTMPDRSHPRKDQDALEWAATRIREHREYYLGRISALEQRITQERSSSDRAAWEDEIVQHNAALARIPNHITLQDVRRALEEGEGTLRRISEMRGELTAMRAELEDLRRPVRDRNHYRFLEGNRIRQRVADENLRPEYDTNGVTWVHVDLQGTGSPQRVAAVDCIAFLTEHVRETREALFAMRGRVEEQPNPYTRETPEPQVKSGRPRVRELLEQLVVAGELLDRVTMDGGFEVRRVGIHRVTTVIWPMVDGWNLMESNYPEEYRIRPGEREVDYIARLERILKQREAQVEQFNQVRQRIAAACVAQRRFMDHLVPPRWENGQPVWDLSTEIEEEGRQWADRLDLRNFVQEPNGLPEGIRDLQLRAMGTSGVSADPVAYAQWVQENIITVCERRLQERIAHWRRAVRLVALGIIQDGIQNGIPPGLKGLRASWNHFTRENLITRPPGQEVIPEPFLNLAADSLREAYPDGLPQEGSRPELNTPRTSPEIVEAFQRIRTAERRQNQALAGGTLEDRVARETQLVIDSMLDVQSWDPDGPGNCPPRYRRLELETDAVYLSRLERLAQAIEGEVEQVQQAREALANALAAQERVRNREQPPQRWENGQPVWNDPPEVQREAQEWANGVNLTDFEAQTEGELPLALRRVRLRPMGQAGVPDDSPSAYAEWLQQTVTQESGRVQTELENQWNQLIRDEALRIIESCRSGTPPAYEGLALPIERYIAAAADNPNAVIPPSVMNLAFREVTTRYPYGLPPQGESTPPSSPPPVTQPPSSRGVSGRGERRATPRRSQRYLIPVPSPTGSTGSQDPQASGNFEVEGSLVLNREGAALSFIEGSARVGETVLDYHLYTEYADREARDVVFIWRDDLGNWIQDFERAANQNCVIVLMQESLRASLDLVEWEMLETEMASEVRADLDLESRAELVFHRNVEVFLVDNGAEEALMPERDPRLARLLEQLRQGESVETSEPAARIGGLTLHELLQIELRVLNQSLRDPSLRIAPEQRQQAIDSLISLRVIETRNPSLARTSLETHTLRTLSRLRIDELRLREAREVLRRETDVEARRRAEPLERMREIILHR